jgi:hypothetical protein
VEEEGGANSFEAEGGAAPAAGEGAEERRLFRGVAC